MTAFQETLLGPVDHSHLKEDFSYDYDPSAMPDFKKRILPLVEAGKITPMIYQALPFEKLLEAKAIMDSNQHLGKIVLAGTPEEA